MEHRNSDLKTANSEIERLIETHHEIDNKVDRLNAQIMELEESKKALQRRLDVTTATGNQEVNVESTAL